MTKIRLLADSALIGALFWIAGARAADAPLVRLQPDPAPEIAAVMLDPSKDPELSGDQLIRALRAKVKYVFVIFNENHSFDNEFGTFPGVDGLYSDGVKPRAAADTPGFRQVYKDESGAEQSVEPFKLGPAQNATVIDSVDHSHKGLSLKMHVVNGVAKMDGFAADEFARFKPGGSPGAALQAKNFARIVMSHIDCDTIPLYWNYANRFTIFDNIFATENTPSTPNAIALIAGQSGETQWVKHGVENVAMSAGDAKGVLQPTPIVNDPQPFWGSQFDKTVNYREPSSPSENYRNNNIAVNLTFASLPLTFMGRDILSAIESDRDQTHDLADVAGDIPAIVKHGARAVSWRWYQEGYDVEPTDANGVASHKSYVSHHQGPQYFGYVANNPAQQSNLRGEDDFFAEMAAKALPADGGVFYLRGGFNNNLKQTTPIQNPSFPAALSEKDIAAIRTAKAGDDDHPGYSDRQISEAMAARAINAIARSPYWDNSAIVITYDESDGFYDHVAPRVLSYGPDKLPLARGLRIPMTVISPYARAHAASHAEGDHNSVIETINAIFDLPALASLPEEAKALKDGEAEKFNGPDGFVQHHLGPRDLNSPQTDSLLSAFDP